ncbi:MAG: hypothetical protein H6Q00_1879 [Holophagaceae bacterium]|nr:hypothetical protein [Holophagaceae bacterium]
MTTKQTSSADGQTSEQNPEILPSGPFVIELADVPALRPRSSPPSPEPSASVVAEASHAIELYPVSPEPSPEWIRVKSLVGKGFFNPFKAFGDELDWGRFVRAQGFLILASLLWPILFLGITSFLSAILYHGVAALYSTTPPNSFIELAIYPVVFVFVKNYWIAYLLLPLAVLALGWLWALVVAWAVDREAGADFKKRFCILAMLGAMFAPFVLFSFVRLLVLILLIAYTAKRMKEHFEIDFAQMLKYAGVPLLIAAVSYSFFERRVEALFSRNSELSANLNAYYFKHRKLEWPSRAPEVMPSHSQLLYEGVGSLDPEVRQRAMQEVAGILDQSGETPEIRFRLASRLAELGNVKGMIFLAKAYRSGHGVPANPSKALDWMCRAAEKDPSDTGCQMEVADLLILNNRVLEGKRHFVSLAKNNMDSLGDISAFITGHGYGAPDRALTWDVQNLYKTEVSPAYLSNSRYRSWEPNSMGDKLDVKSDLLARIASLDRNGNQWFYRALVTDYASLTPADSEVYGESGAAESGEELARAMETNNPAELEALGDRFLKAGDAASARKFWLKATTVIDSDYRQTNAKFYLKLAESFDPTTQSNASPNAQQAIRFYLGYMLLTDYSGYSKPTVFTALARLGVPLDRGVDISSAQYLILCTKYDVPEAWAIVGSYHLGGNLKGIPKDREKARECLRRASQLGYKGPLVRTFS